MRLAERVVENLDVPHQKRNANCLDHGLFGGPAARNLLCALTIGLFPFGKHTGHEARIFHRLRNPSDLHNIDAYADDHGFIMSVNYALLRYLVHAVDGQTYGPADLATINQWIVEGRVAPTTLLQPEGSSMRIAASTVDGLVWGQGQTFEAYTPLKINAGVNELRGAWVCIFGSLVLCCLPVGFHLAAGIAGCILSLSAYRKGHRIALLTLIINLVFLFFIAQAHFGQQSNFDPQKYLRAIKGLPKFPGAD